MQSFLMFVSRRRRIKGSKKFHVRLVYTKLCHQEKEEHAALIASLKHSSGFSHFLTFCSDDFLGHLDLIAVQSLPATQQGVKHKSTIISTNTRDLEE